MFGSLSSPSSLRVGGTAPVGVAPRVGYAPISSSVTVGKGSVPNAPGVFTEPVLALLPRGGRTGLSGVVPLCAPRLARLSALYLCDSSFHPVELNEPLRISARVGAFDATLPVAAHMPGGGDASMSFMLAVRIRLDAEAVEALVDVRERRAVVGEFGVAFDDCWPV